MFSPDLAWKIQEADESAINYRHEQLTMDDSLIIMGACSTLLVTLCSVSSLWKQDYIERR
jgi:hypothetical protein